jgi:hypothetical protein
LEIKRKNHTLRVTEGTIEVYPEVQEENHQLKKGIKGCYIESQATIEKQKQQ